MFTYNTIEVENFKFNNHHNLGDTNNVNEQNNIPNYHNIQNNSNLRNNQNIKYQYNSEISRRYHIDSRPTYGAYIHNTLPRGPYLQYKFNDYNQIHNGCINKNDKLLSLSIPQLSSQSSSTMTINDNNHSNSDHYRINRNDLHNIDNTWNNKTPRIQRQTQTLGRYKNNYFSTTNDILYNTPRNHNDLNHQTIGAGNLKMPMPSSSMIHNDLPNVTNMHARCISTSYPDDVRKENALRTLPNRHDVNGKRLKHLNEIGNRNAIVITDSCFENELKLNMNKKTSTVISGKRITASDHIESASNNGIYSYGSYNVNKKSISNHKNYVTLHDVLNVKTTGLNQNEGWALLCQSIQALQDLFLSDSHSFTRILPLINPSNLQITSRGRIALNLMPAEQERPESNILLQHINGSPFKNIMDYLSPEYIKNIDQNKIYSISDIEKMWIYSLGVTLQKTLQNSFDKVFSSDNNTNRINANEKRQKSSLDFVISSMREKNIQQRASLMYLLDIISEYCKTNNQHKPFSHIIIELFNEAITKNEISTYPYTIDSPQHPLLNEQRSDVPRNMLQRNSDLKVVRINSNENLPHHLYKSQPVLVEPNTKMKSADGPIDPNKLQVIRKRNDILKKRKDNRRNTIHGTNIDLQTANKLYVENNLANHKPSDGMNNIQCANIFNSASELNNFENMKALTLPNLKIRRYNLNQNVNKTTSTNHGPEFIVNSNLPVKVINLIDEKSINRRLINVLLLNGQQLHIYCNGTNTTAYQVLEAIIKLENIIDNFFLGLCTLIGGDFVFLPKELKINKIAPATWSQSANKLNTNDTDLPLNLFLRIKFFLPKFRGTETLNSCNFLYFQLRKSVLERHILCTEDDLITLGGLALQAEVGDFEENMKYVEYFTISHYLPEEVYRKNKELARYIRNSHLCKKGLRPSEARDNFIRFVQELKEYGLHLYTAKWIKEKQSLDIYLAISLSGICIFERNSMSLLIDPNTNSKTTYQRKIYETFDWMEIQNLNFSKHVLGINVRKTFSGNRCRTIKFKFKMCDKKSYFAFTLASEHHKFCLKLRKSFHSLKPLADELNIPIGNNKNSSVESSPGKLKCNSSSLNILNEKSRSEPSLSQPFDDVTKSKPNEKMNRFKNIKISMQNDNRLRKIKNKLLRRSDSFAENADTEKTEPPTNTKSENKLVSKEENQNRENECPRVTIVEQCKSVKAQCNTMNRNKVKMGTRVFSPHFLSKSVDNILNSTDLRTFNNNSFKCNKMNESLYDDTCSLVNLNSLKNSSNPLMQHPTVIHSSIPTIHSYYKDVVSSDGNRSRSNGNFTLENESISETLLEKFNNISCSKAGDRVIKTIFIKKDLITNLPKHRSTTILSKLTKYTLFKQPDNVENLNEVESKSDRYTLGISIIEGKDNNVYVKDLITNGPGERSGIKIGDQILAVNGISLFNIPYNESLKILQTTEINVKLTVAQLIAYQVGTVKNIVSNNNSMTITSQERHSDVDINYSRDSHLVHDSSTLNSSHNGSNDTIGFSKFILIDDCQNIISKRMLNLPKIISSSPEIYNEKTNKHSRRFDGHIIYPVTPAKLKKV